jgi:amino acid transporter
MSCHASTCSFTDTALPALYIFFKLYLKSKVISPADMDLETEFISIREWKSEQEMLQSEKAGIKMLLGKVIHSV